MANEDVPNAEEVYETKPDTTHSASEEDSPERAWLKAFGAKGGKARARNMSAEERSEAARRAVTLRWNRWRLAHPEGSGQPKPYRRRK